MKARVMIVDDDDLSPIYLEKLLGEHFAFVYAESGEAALAAVAVENPAVILMDVEMPGGMSGYQACRAIKDNEITENIPVIFISAHNDAENRLKAYHSGGDDYVSKPFNIEELKHKVSLALATQATRSALADKAKRATTVAMASMREAADFGVVLGFLSDIIRQFDLAQIAATTLHTLHKFQIEGAVQLRQGCNRVSRNSAGACTPVEDAVLGEMAGGARIVDLGNRSAFNYERATIIIYNMPLQEAELYGRLRDTLVKMAEALDVHMLSLEAVASALNRGNTLLELLQRNIALSRDVHTRLAARRDVDSDNLMRIADSTDTAAQSEDSSATRKSLLHNLAQDIRTQAQTTRDESTQLENLVQLAFSGFDESLLQAQSQASPAPDSDDTAGTAQISRAELF